MTQGRNGGISLLQNFTLNKQVLTENEKKDILIAIQSLNSFNKESAKSIFSKLSSLFGENQRDYSATRFVMKSYDMLKVA